MKELQSKPNYISSTKKARYIEMGNLTSYRQYMIDNQLKHGAQSSSMAADRMWSGTKSYDTFLDLIENGDEEVMRNIKVATDKKVAELGKKYEEVLEQYKFDVQGQFFDIGLVLSGVPETWLEPEITEEEKVQVEIIVNGTFSSNTDKNSIVKGASHLLGMTRILEDHGVQVKLKIVSCINNHDTSRKDMYVATDIKDYDEPINYAKCSSLLSPTYLRRGIFKVLEMECPTLKGTYGRTIQEKNFIELKDVKQLTELENKLFTKG